MPNGRVREMSKGSGISSSVTSSVGTGSEGSDMLSSKLSAAPPEQQKQILGERLYPLVHKHKVILAYLHSWCIARKIVFSTVRDECQCVTISSCL